MVMTKGGEARELRQLRLQLLDDRVDAPGPEPLGLPVIAHLVRVDVQAMNASMRSRSSITLPEYANSISGTPAIHVQFMPRRPR